VWILKRVPIGYDVNRRNSVRFKVSSFIFREGTKKGAVTIFRNRQINESLSEANQSL
jgi:hypothetical protein